MASLSPNRSSSEHHAIETFLRLDRLGVALGAMFVVVVNSLFVQVTAVYWILLPLLVLAGLLTIGLRHIRSGSRVPALALVLLGNWAIALIVATMFPLLWPVMVLTVLMPLVLSTPYLSERGIVLVIAGGALTTATVGLIGIVLDDDGVIEDIDDRIELVLVVGALAAQSVPIGLTVWQNNRIVTNTLIQTNALNDDLEQSQDELARSRRRLVETADRERGRIERDLHDGAQQRLVALSVRLRLLESQAGDEPTRQQLTDIVSELDEAADELRELAHGIYPPILQARGLPDALRAIARRSPGNLSVTAGAVGRFSPSVETALYYAALEAITNATKHAPDAALTVGLDTSDAGTCRLTIEDDGPGFDVAAKAGSRGLLNIKDRIGALNGTVDIISTTAGTTVMATIPLDLATE